jgi:hypothetical protein
MDIGIGQHLWLLLVSVCLKSSLSHNLELAGLSLKVLGQVTVLLKTWKVIHFKQIYWPFKTWCKGIVQQRVSVALL